MRFRRPMLTDLINATLCLFLIALLSFFVVEWEHSRSRKHLQKLLWPTTLERQMSLPTLTLGIMRDFRGAAGRQTTVVNELPYRNPRYSRPSTSNRSVPFSAPRAERRNERTTIAQPTTVKRAQPVFIERTTKPSTKYHLLAIILSASTYSERRSAARLVWRHDGQLQGQLRKKSFYSYFFVCGRSKDDAVRERLLTEKNREGDIIVADVAETYAELTKKVLWSMKWALTNAKFNYLLKTDDDVFVNLSELFLAVPWSLIPKFYLGCTAGSVGKRGVPVKRDPHSKWYVPTSGYRPNYFPPYNQGHGYFLSRDAVTTCLNQAADQQLIPVEDAFVGIVLLKANITAKNNPHIHDRINRRACNDNQALIIGGILPKALRLMVQNMRIKKPLCTGDLFKTLVKW